MPAPPVKLPADLAVAGAELVERIGLPLPISSDEARSASLWWTYSGAKAKRELGYASRPHEETLVDAVSWQMEVLGESIDREPGLAERALFTAAAAARAAGRLVPR